MSYLTLKVSCCRVFSTLVSHPGICAKKKSSPNLSHCGHSFYITVPIMLNNSLLYKPDSPTLHICFVTAPLIHVTSQCTECFRAINRLQKNDDIIITKPHKGSGVVLLNKSDYVDKINEILDDQSKFKTLGPVSITTQQWQHNQH